MWKMPFCIVFEDHTAPCKWKKEKKKKKKKHLSSENFQLNMETSAKKSKEI